MLGMAFTVGTGQLADLQSQTAATGQGTPTGVTVI